MFQVSPRGDQILDEIIENGTQQMMVNRIYSGGDHSFASTIKTSTPASSEDCRYYA